jgi:hypothetical protein
MFWRCEEEHACMGAFWPQKAPREGYIETFGTKVGETVPKVDRRLKRHVARFEGPTFFWKNYLIKK